MTMTHLNSPTLVTREQLCNVLDLNKSYLSRVDGLDDFSVGVIPNPTGKGRSVSIYREEVINLLPKRLQQKWIECKGAKQKLTGIRKSRNDHGTPRVPKAESKERRIEIENEIVHAALEYYVSQNLIDSIKTAVWYSVRDWLAYNDLPADFKSPTKMMEYYYHKRVMRKDKHFTGYAIRDNWNDKQAAFRDARKTAKFNGNTSWEWIEIFHSENLLGRGYGAGDLWFIDGTKMDCYVEIRKGNSKKVVRLNLLLIVCLFTGQILAIRPVPSENSISLTQIVADAVNRHGVPRYGIMADHGSAMKSKAFVSFVRSLYTSQQLKDMKDGRGCYSWVKKILGEQPNAPVYLPPAEIPSAPLKGKGERAIKEFNRIIARLDETKDSWQADRNRKYHPTISHTNVALMRLARPAEEAFPAVVNHVNNGAYQTYPRTDLIKFQQMAEEQGLEPHECEPNIGNAWDYFGGNERRPDYPIENSEMIWFYSIPDQIGNTHLKHRITLTTLETAPCTHQGEKRNYLCANIPHQLRGEEICIVPYPDDPSRAKLFLEADSSRWSELTPEPHSVYFIGEAVDDTMRNMKDISEYKARRNVRKESMERFKDSLEGINPRSWNTEPTKELEAPKSDLRLPSAIPNSDRIRYSEPREDIHENIIDEADYEVVDEPENQVYDPDEDDLTNEIMKDLDKYKF